MQDFKFSLLKTSSITSAIKTVEQQVNQHHENSKVQSIIYICSVKTARLLHTVEPESLPLVFFLMQTQF